MQFLNSRPWRFPWIGWSEPGWYWDKGEKKCKLKRLWGLRWEQQPLVGLSAPEAYLAGIHLCGADLRGANLQQADLWGANLQQADLWGANLQQAYLWGAKKLTFNQIKSACFWSEAIYKGEWRGEMKTKTWVAENEQAKQDNENYIEKLKKDKASDPKKKPDCSIWEKRE